MRIPSYPPFRPGSQSPAKAEHSEAIEEVSRVEPTRNRKQKQDTANELTNQLSGLPAVTEPASHRHTGYARWQHSVPFLAQLISQTHWSRPRRSAAPAPQEATGAYAATDHPEHSLKSAASNQRISRIV